MFADKGTAAATASVVPEATSECNTKSRRLAAKGTGSPCDPQGAAGLLWAYSFKCDARVQGREDIGEKMLPPRAPYRQGVMK